MAKRERISLRLVDDLHQSDLFLTTRTHYRRKPQRVRDAEALGIPVYVLKGNDGSQLRQCLHTLSPGLSRSGYVHQLQEMLAQQNSRDRDTARPRSTRMKGLL
jgi:hypothetical protein